MSRGRGWALRLHWLSILLLGSLALMLLTYGLARAQEPKVTENKKPWTGKLADGRVITQADLDQILQMHALWLKSYRKEGKRAKLSNADLSRASLVGANLTWASLEKANLSEANLGYANLS